MLNIRQLRKLKREDLFQLLIEQAEEIERLKCEMDSLNNRLNEKTIKLDNVGSLAEASIAISNIFEEAQKVADIYLANVKRMADNNEND